MAKKTKVGCCGRAKQMEAEYKALKAQFDIAWRALHYYRLEANSLRADDAIARITAIRPVVIPQDVTKDQS